MGSTKAARSRIDSLMNSLDEATHQIRKWRITETWMSPEKKRMFDQMVAKLNAEKKVLQLVRERIVWDKIKHGWALAVTSLESTIDKYKRGMIKKVAHRWIDNLMNSLDEATHQIRRWRITETWMSPQKRRMFDQMVEKLNAEKKVLQSLRRHVVDTGRVQHVKRQLVRRKPVGWRPTRATPDRVKRVRGRPVRGRTVSTRLVRERSF